MTTKRADEAVDAFKRGLSCSQAIFSVSGALMVIGLSQRPEDIQDPSSREKVYAKARRFLDEFTARNASVNCTELVGYDLSDPKQFAEAREKKVFSTRCSKLVRDAGEILEGLLP